MTEHSTAPTARPVPTPSDLQFFPGPVSTSLDPLPEWVMFGLSHYQQDDPPTWPQRILEELPPDNGALGEYLEHLPPGERLAKLLSAITLEEVDDYSLVEVVAAYKRMEAWSAAKAAEAAGALAEREALNPIWPGNLPGRTRGECVAGEELAMRLRVSRLTAVRMTACGRAFAGMFEPTGEALASGHIDYPRAQAIVSALEALPAEIAVAAQWEVIDKAPGRTLRQVQEDLAKAIIAVDPDGADARHRTARTKRRVNRPRPLPDGMASISAVLSAADAIALDTALEAAARAAKNNGSTRTLDQLRADSLALMGHTALELGHIGPHPDTHCTCGCTTTTPGAVVGSPDEANTTVGAAEQAGTSPAPAPADPGPGPASPSAPAPAPAPASGDPEPGSPGSPAPPAPASANAARTADEPPHPSHRVPGCCVPMIRLGMLGGGRADIRVTVPLSVLLPDPHAPQLSALDRDPVPVAELEGYGPIPPEVARALATGGVWRRLVTDPTGTEVVDVGRTRYQPTAAIADHVRERDRTCTRPACSSPARTCDLDHMQEWQDGGETSVLNVQALCRRDHPIKSIGAFTVARATDGTYAWTTPTGHGYLRRREGTVVTLPHGTAEGLRVAGRQATRSRHSVDPAVVDDILATVAAGSDAGGVWTPPPGTPTPSNTTPWPVHDPGPSWSGHDDEPPF